MCKSRFRSNCLFQFPPFSSVHFAPVCIFYKHRVDCSEPICGMEFRVTFYGQPYPNPAAANVCDFYITRALSTTPPFGTPSLTSFYLNFSAPVGVFQLESPLGVYVLRNLEQQHNSSIISSFFTLPSFNMHTYQDFYMYKYIQTGNRGRCQVIVGVCAKC